MSTLALLAVGLALGYAWVRGVRRTRLAWLRQLNLVGSWERVPGDGEGARSLVLVGGLAAGDYVAKRGRGAGAVAEERGAWRLRGHTLVLTPGHADPRHFELRQFGPGKIGLDGPGRAREIYVRASDNVVPLRARH